MDMSAKFWDRMAEGYSKSPIADEEAYQKKLQITQGYFKADMDVLEFGCGTGSTAIIHAPYVKHYHAIDISPKMIEIAQNKADAQNIQNITFEASSMDELKAADQSYDAVLGLSILHLLKNREEVIAQVYDSLKPGGVFVSSTVCIGDTKMKYLMPFLLIGRLFGLVLKALTAEGLETSLRNAGFEIDYKWCPNNAGVIFLVAKK